MSVGTVEFALDICLMALCAASLVPVRFSKGFRTLSLYYPVMAIFVIAAYEVVVRLDVPPESVPIRIDLLVERPLRSLVLLVGVLRWSVFLLHRTKECRLLSLVWLQVAGELVVLAGLALWTKTHWEEMATILQWEFQRAFR